MLFRPALLSDGINRLRMMRLAVALFAACFVDVEGEGWSYCTTEQNACYRYRLVREAKQELLIEWELLNTA